MKNYDRIHDFRLDLVRQSVDYALKGEQKGKKLHSHELFSSGMFPGSLIVTIFSERLVEHVLKTDFEGKDTTTATIDLK